jgi:hypothetical protein
MQRALLFLLTILLVGYGLVRLLRARQRTELSAPLLATSLAQLAPDPLVMNQRQRTMVHEGNLWEAARDLARQCLPAGPEDHPPRIIVTGGWWRRRRLTKLVMRLWRLAAGAQPERVSAHEFTRVIAQVESVKSELAHGTMRLEDPEGNGRQA